MLSQAWFSFGLVKAEYPFQMMSVHSEALSIDPWVCIEKEHISYSDCSFSDSSNVHKMRLPHILLFKRAIVQSV